MNHLYNDQKLKDRRKELRRNQTEPELILWNRLKNKQCNGYRFLRQYSVGAYILDLYCPELRLGIEIDGGQHNEPEHIKYDLERTKFLSENNIKILRFWNSEIKDNLEGVYDKILEYCK
jgi:very-short-patch-repair endonuclease